MSCPQSYDPKGTKYRDLPDPIYAQLKKEDRFTGWDVLLWIVIVVIAFIARCNG